MLLSQTGTLPLSPPPAQKKSRKIRQVWYRRRHKGKCCLTQIVAELLISGLRQRQAVLEFQASQDHTIKFRLKNKTKSEDLKYMGCPKIFSLGYLTTRFKFQHDMVCWGILLCWTFGKGKQYKLSITYPKYLSLEVLYTVFLFFLSFFLLLVFFWGGGGGGQGFSV